LETRFAHGLPVARGTQGFETDSDR
jgi:hypothetical protein